MIVLRGVRKVRKFKSPIVALGVFDGVHRGHCNILKSASSCAHDIRGTSIALTFDPHPQKEESLTSLEHRLRLIASQGIDVCLIVNFNKNFQNISAEDFIKDILVNKLRAAFIFVGANFKFGKGAQGNINTLRKFSKIYNYKLKFSKVIKIKNRPVSSTSIRALIKKGNLEGAKRLLSRPVTVWGSVIRGTKMGSRLGFPTANINPHHEVIPPQGVYAARIILGARKFNGVCNIGARRTFYKHGKTHIEVHLFDFHKNIYGKFLEIEFIKKIRDEKKFPSAASLIDQIRKDITFAKALLSRH